MSKYISKEFFEMVCKERDSLQDKVDKLAAVIHMLDYVHNNNPPKSLYGKGGIAIINGARKLLDD